MVEMTSRLDQMNGAIATSAQSTFYSPDTKKQLQKIFAKVRR